MASSRRVASLVAEQKTKEELRVAKGNEHEDDPEDEAYQLEEATTSLGGAGVGNSAANGAKKRSRGAVQLGARG